MDRCFARSRHAGLEAVPGRAAVPARGKLPLCSAYVGYQISLTVQVRMPKRRLAYQGCVRQYPSVFCLADMEVGILQQQIDLDPASSASHRSKHVAPFEILQRSR